MRKKRFLILLLFLAVAGGTFGVWKSRGEVGDDLGKEGTTETEEPESTAEDGTGYVVRFGGMVVPQAILQVKLEGERKVKVCRVKVGDTVRQGQTLFLYDTAEEENQAEQLKLEIEKAKGEIDSAKAAIERLEKDQKAAGADSQLTYATDILTQQNNIKINEYNIKTKTMEMEQLQERIQNAEVKAEVSGQVQKITQPDSETSENGAYMTILQSGNFRIRCVLKEQDAAAVYEGMEVDLLSRVDAGKKWKGTVTEILTDGEEEAGNAAADEDDSSDSASAVCYVEAESTDGMMLGQHLIVQPVTAA